MHPADIQIPYSLEHRKRARVIVLEKRGTARWNEFEIQALMQLGATEQEVPWIHQHQRFPTVLLVTGIDWTAKHVAMILQEASSWTLRSVVGMDNRALPFPVPHLENGKTLQIV